MATRLEWNIALCGVVVVMLAGCASSPSPVAIDPAAALKRVQASCKRLLESNLRAPFSTDVSARMQEIKAARKRGRPQRAALLANSLADTCEEEAQSRAEVVKLSTEIYQNRTQYKAAHYVRFVELARSGRYSDALYCGEGLLQGTPESCGFSTRPQRAPRSISLTPPGARVAKGRPQVIHRAPLVRKRAEHLPPAAPLRRGGQPSRATAEQAELPPDLSSEEDMAEGAAKPRHLWSWVLMGGGGGMLLTGAILAGLAQAKYDELEESCPNCTQEDIDSGKQMVLSADVLLGVGPAVAAAGVVLFFLERRWIREARSARTDLSPRIGLSPGGLAIFGRF